MLEKPERKDMLEKKELAEIKDLLVHQDNQDPKDQLDQLVQWADEGQMDLKDLLETTEKMACKEALVPEELKA